MSRRQPLASLRRSLTGSSVERSRAFGSPPRNRAGSALPTCPKGDGPSPLDPAACRSRSAPTPPAGWLALSCPGRSDQLTAHLKDRLVSDHGGGLDAGHMGITGAFMYREENGRSLTEQQRRERGEKIGRVGRDSFWEVIER